MDIPTFCNYLFNQAKTEISTGALFFDWKVQISVALDFWQTVLRKYTLVQVRSYQLKSLEVKSGSSLYFFGIVAWSLDTLIGQGPAD